MEDYGIYLLVRKNKEDSPHNLSWGFFTWHPLVADPMGYFGTVYWFIEDPDNAGKWIIKCTDGGARDIGPRNRDRLVLIYLLSVIDDLQYHHLSKSLYILRANLFDSVEDILLHGLFPWFQETIHPFARNGSHEEILAEVNKLTDRNIEQAQYGQVVNRTLCFTPR
jgi:hypothetical protein